MAGDGRFVVDDPRFGSTRSGGENRVETRTPEVVVVEPPRRGCLRSCFSGCLWIAVVLAILGAVGGFLLWQNWRNVAANIGSAAVKQTIEASDLPAQEKDEIGVQVDRVADALRDGRLNQQQIEQFVHLLVESPLATSMAVAVIDGKYLDSSGLSDAEKEAGRRTLARFARGVLDNVIPEARRDATLSHLAEKKSDGSWELRDRVSDDDLRAFFAAASAEADNANIAEQPPVIDLSDELRKIVDEALDVAEAPPVERSGENGEP